MTQKPIAVDGMSLDLSGPDVGFASVIPAASVKTKVEGKGIYSGATPVLVTGCIKGTCAQTAPVAGSINPSSLKAKEFGQAVVREGDDTGDFPVAGIDSSTSAPCTILVNVSVDDAGQNKVTTE